MKPSRKLAKRAAEIKRLRRMFGLRGGLGAVSVRGSRGQAGFNVRIGEDEIECFRGRWPASGLHGLRAVWAGFESNGDLVDLSCNRPNASCERWDGEALKALVDDMQCAGEARLGVPDGRCTSQDWRKCLSVKPLR